MKIRETDPIEQFLLLVKECAPSQGAHQTLRSPAQSEAPWLVAYSPEWGLALVGAYSYHLPGVVRIVCNWNQSVFSDLQAPLSPSPFLPFAAELQVTQNELRDPLLAWSVLRYATGHDTALPASFKFEDRLVEGAPGRLYAFSQAASAILDAAPALRRAKLTEAQVPALLTSVEKAISPEPPPRLSPQQWRFCRELARRPVFRPATHAQNVGVPSEEARATSAAWLELEAVKRGILTCSKQREAENLWLSQRLASVFKGNHDRSTVEAGCRAALEVVNARS